MCKTLTLLIPCLAVLALFSGCSSDSNPFSPENLTLTELAYFPLQNGYRADYRYYYGRTSGYMDFHTGYIENRSWKEGEFHLEVSDVFTKADDKTVYYRIKTTLTITSSYFYNSSNLQDTTWLIRSDSTTTSDYNIILQNGALWCVQNAPSFDRLDEGDTTLMMSSPIACGGEIHLDLFPVRAYLGAPIILNQISSYNDNLGLCKYYGYQNTSCNTVKNKGIVEIEYMYSYRGLSYLEEYVEKLELIE